MLKNVFCLKIIYIFDIINHKKKLSKMKNTQTTHETPVVDMRISDNANHGGNYIGSKQRGILRLAYKGIEHRTTYTLIHVQGL
jgi:hypothetical protein